MPFSLPHDSHASCEAGSQLCFLSQSSFMWSLPHVLPVPLCSVDSENGGGAPCGGLRQNREKSFLLSLATWTNLQRHNNVRLLPVFTFTVTTFLSAKNSHSHELCVVDEQRLMWYYFECRLQNLLFLFQNCHFVAVFLGEKKFFFYFWDETVLLSWFYTKQDRTALSRRRSEFSSVNFVGFVTLLRNVDCDGWLGILPFLFPKRY